MNIQKGDSVTCKLNYISTLKDIMFIKDNKYKVTHIGTYGIELDSETFPHYMIGFETFIKHFDTPILFNKDTVLSIIEEQKKLIERLQQIADKL